VRHCGGQDVEGLLGRWETDCVCEEVVIGWWVASWRWGPNGGCVKEMCEGSVLVDERGEHLWLL
jgi:hypothetical protein